MTGENLVQLHTSETDMVTIENDAPMLDLVLRKGKSSTRVVKGLAIEVGSNNEVLQEITYELEGAIISLDDWTAETTGMSQNDIIRYFATRRQDPLVISKWPLHDGKRTTPEQFSMGMLNQLLKETFISTSILLHLVTIRDGGKISDLHRRLRTGN